MSSNIPAGSLVVRDKYSSRSTELDRYFDYQADPRQVAEKVVEAFARLEGGFVEPLVVSVQFDWHDLDGSHRERGRSVLLVNQHLVDPSLPANWKEWATVELVPAIDSATLAGVMDRCLTEPPPRPGLVSFWEGIQLFAGRFVVGPADGSGRTVVIDEDGGQRRDYQSIDREGLRWVYASSLDVGLPPLGVQFINGGSNPQMFSLSFSRFWSYYADDGAPGERWLSDYVQSTQPHIAWDSVSHGQGVPYEDRVEAQEHSPNQEASGGSEATAESDLLLLPVYERQTSGEYFETEFANCWPEFWWGFPGFALQRFGIEIPEEEPLSLFRTESGSAALRAEVSTYLDAAPMAVVGMVPEQKCEFCDVMIHIASQQSDGVWLWPSDLGHRVAEHGFYVPNRFVDHIRAQGRPPADLLGVDVDRLPWPNRAE